MKPQRFVLSGTVRLALYEWGVADGRPTVLLVHGYPDNAGVWQATAECLAQRYHVVAYDVRGAGKSSAPLRTREYAMEHLVADLAAVVQAVSPTRLVHLVAHDWGSIQCWSALRNTALAGRIASYSSISGPDLDQVGDWMRRQLARPSWRSWWAVFRQLFLSWYVYLFHLPLLVPLAWRFGMARLWPRFLQRVERVPAAASEGDAQTRAQDGARGVRLYRANFLRHVLRPRPQAVDLPVQLIVPTRDRYVSAALFEGLDHWAPRLWRREIAGGHWLALSHPELLARQVAQFIDFIESGKENQMFKRLRYRSGGLPYSGKLAVVTGAGSGIGRETLLALAEQGADVVAADLNADAAERSAELARLLGARAHARRVDVGSAEAMEAFAGWVVAELGAPDIVINNAGIGLAGRFLDTTVADWEQVLRVNLWGVIHGARLFGRQMVDAGKAGHIVNVASAAAYAPTRTLPAYCTSKASVRMLSDCLRAELADQGIRVTTVCPGFTNTPITRNTRFVGVDGAEERRLRAASERLYRLRNLPASAVAKAILRALASGQAEVPVGLEAHVTRFVAHSFPGLARRLARLELSPK